MKKPIRLMNPNATAEDPCSGCPDKDSERCNVDQCWVQDPDSPDETLKWKRIAYEFRHFPGTMSSTYFHLCQAIVRADIDNTERLKKAYPELVKFLQEWDL